MRELNTALVSISRHVDRRLVRNARSLTNKDHPVPKFVARIANSSKLYK